MHTEHPDGRLGGQIRIGVELDEGVGAIGKRVDPADLPAQAPTKYELVIRRCFKWRYPTLRRAASEPTTARRRRRTLPGAPTDRISPTLHFCDQHLVIGFAEPALISRLRRSMISVGVPSQPSH
jgi:hypothetical protein